MQMKEVGIDVATVDQLKWFMKTELGIEAKTDDLAKLRATVEVSHDSPNIMVPENLSTASAKTKIKAGAPLEQGIKGTTKEAVVTAGKGRGMVDRTSGGDPKVTINIPAQPGPGGARHVPVSVNGRTILLPRGKNIEIAYRYYHALVLAEERHYEQVPDPAGGPTPIQQERDVPSYPFNVIEMPPKAEIQAWIAKQDDEGQAEQAAATAAARARASAKAA